MKRIVSGVASVSDAQMNAADANGDSKINSFDTNLLARFIAGYADLAEG